MRLSRCVLVVTLCLTLSGLPAPVSAQETTAPPMPLSLNEAIRMSVENNLDIKAASFTPEIRGQDILFQQAAFDPNLGFSAFKSDNSQPSQNVFDIGAAGQVVGIDSTVNVFTTGFLDPLSWGASYSANLNLTRFTSTSANAVFPTTYQTNFEVAYNQSLLRNFGRKPNQTQIVLAQTSHEISRSQFRDEVLRVLKETEDAYWELVFAQQDLAVKRESLRLAEELLKLNRIKVQVGTLPPIEITQAEAEVANREQGVIVAENTVLDAEDSLRRVMNLPKGNDAWFKPIAPSDEPDFEERAVDLNREIEEAISQRPDLEQARLEIVNSDTRLAFDRNQMKWDLSFRATYTLRGLSGDRDALLVPADPTDPNSPLITLPAQNENFLDGLEFVRDRDFESWSAFLGLSIPIGNNAAQASYVNSRLAKEQSEVGYENARLKAEVEVRTAARAILTDRKRIEAAEKNVELQRKKVEAEQKKFENGMSTSFQVLEFQEDLTTALGTKNRALVDYRKSLSALERAKGTLDSYLSVTIR